MPVGMYGSNLNNFRNTRQTCVSFELLPAVKKSVALIVKIIIILEAPPWKFTQCMKIRCLRSASLHFQTTQQTCELCRHVTV